MLNHSFLTLYQKVINYKTRNQLIVVLVIINLFSCVLETKNKNVVQTDSDKKEVLIKPEKIKINNGTVDEKLVFYYNKAINSTGNIKSQYEKLFFDAFPSSFMEMKRIFGYIGNTEGVLSDYKKGEKILSFFSNLKSIKPKNYYTKYINICINGNFESDFIVSGFGLGDKILGDNGEYIIKLLANHSDDEIESVLYFIFDEPIPDENYFNSIYNKVKPINLRVAKLMKKSFQKINKLKH